MNTITFKKTSNTVLQLRLEKVKGLLEQGYELVKSPVIGSDYGLSTIAKNLSNKGYLVKKVGIQLCCKKKLC